jgi:hypothetical protein
MNTQRLRAILRDYHRFLGQSVFKRPKDIEFWEYHRTALRELGHPLGRGALAGAAARAVLEVLTYPVRAVRKVVGSVDGKHPDVPQAANAAHRT